MPSEKRQFGDLGEAKATEFLKQKGYRILDRNYRLAYGEIDIIAAKTAGILLTKIKELVFVEVKTVRDEGLPNQAALAAQNVHFWKQQRLIKAVKTYLAHKKIPPEIPWRIDVIIVVLNGFNNPAKIEHLENAVWEK